jgi:hypothetical protein
MGNLRVYHPDLKFDPKLYSKVEAVFNKFSDELDPEGGEDTNVDEEGLVKELSALGVSGKIKVIDPYCPEQYTLHIKPRPQQTRMNGRRHKPRRC